MQRNDPSQIVFPNVVDRGAALLFDWLVEGPGTTRAQYKLLSEPIGPSRGLEETNMRSPEGLQPGHGYLTQSLHCFYGQMAESDRELFRDNYTVGFWILQKKFYEAPLRAIPFQGVVFPWAVASSESEWRPGYVAPGSPPIQPGNFGAIPRYIPWQNCPFWIELTGKPVSLIRGLRFLPVLNGYLDRPVQ